MTERELSIYPVVQLLNIAQTGFSGQECPLCRKVFAENDVIAMIPYDGFNHILLTEGKPHRSIGVHRRCAQRAPGSPILSGRFYSRTERERDDWKAKVEGLERDLAAANAKKNQTAEKLKESHAAQIEKLIEGLTHMLTRSSLPVHAHETATPQTEVLLLAGIMENEIASLRRLLKKAMRRTAQFEHFERMRQRLEQWAAEVQAERKD